MDIGSGVGVVLNNSSSTLDSIFQSNGLGSFVNFVFMFLIFLRIVSIIWTAKDIISRTNNTGLQVLSILLVTFLTPLFGLPLYFIVRPVYFKRDLIPRREASALSLVNCTNCHTLNPKEYECCITCGEKLKIVCKQCNKEYPHMYAYCPICGAPNIE
ncbi:MAG: hypothetical protein NTX91_02650 [candidate division SR1 bacterium]|nr:hypothetical protein [candidate division SR1 bacterium]